MPWAVRARLGAVRRAFGAIHPKRGAPGLPPGLMSWLTEEE